MLIITHYQRLLERIKPDVVHIFINGSIVQSGGPELANEIEKNGFEGFANVG
jgi:Fe-S cluster assembly ATP-binding protein